MNIVIAGPKGVGKSTVGEAFARRVGLEAVETDRRIEGLHRERTGESTSCRDIFRRHGEEHFRQLERDAVRSVARNDWQVIVTGGSTLLDVDSRRILRDGNLLVWLDAADDVAWTRATTHGLPPWLDGPDGETKFKEQLAQRREAVRPFADVVLDTSEDKPETLAEKLQESIAQELAVCGRDANTYGEVIRVTTFGESHGPAIGAVFDGVRPGLPFDLDDIQRQMNRRRPGQSDVVTPRSEKDRVVVLSGVFEGKTTGAPIAMAVFNEDQDSSKYEAIRDLFRPGHADYTYYKKYGIRDHRGGGRSSGRETAGRVMCGAAALGMLKERGVRIVAHAIEIAGVRAEMCDYEAIERNPVRCADPIAAREMEKAILAARDDEDSVGGIVKLEIEGVPAGLGDPVFEKLDARLTRAIMTLGAVKAIEIGDGFALCRMRGSESNDEMVEGGFASNHAGGIAGGISTGQPIALRIGIKPTASIASPQQTVDLEGTQRPIETHGRHDPCIVPRVIPVIETMAALALLDAWEVQARLRPGWGGGA